MGSVSVAGTCSTGQGIVIPAWHRWKQRMMPKLKQEESKRMYRRFWLLDKTWDNGITWRYKTPTKVRGTNVVYIVQAKGGVPAKTIHGESYYPQWVGKRKKEKA